MIWAANPVGVQPMPNAQAFALLPSSGYVPLQSFGRQVPAGRAARHADRRGGIVAASIGAKVIGWKPQQIDMSTLTSKWGYTPPKSSLDTKSFGNPVTSRYSKQSKTDTSKGGSYARASSWSNGNVEAHSSAIESASGETEAAGIA